MKYAVVFPGQGSQSQGMLATLAEEFSEVKTIFSEASEVLGYDLWDIIQNNPDDKLNKTEYTQPAMLTAGVALWRIWNAQNETLPNLMAGHSLGEYTALVASDVMQFSDAVSLVAERGRLMQAAVPEGQGGMAAILGLDDDQVRSVCNDAADHGVVEAVNFNSPGQVVIAGEAKAVQKAAELAKEAGAKRALPLPVSVPSHSSLMRDAADKLAERLAKITLSKATVPVLHNVNASICNSVEEIAENLQQQLYSPVLWVDTINKIATDDINTVFEFGPGKVLAGLCKRINRSIQGVPVESVEGLEKAKSILSGE